MKWIVRRNIRLSTTNMHNKCCSQSWHDVNWIFIALGRYWFCSSVLVSVLKRRFQRFHGTSSDTSVLVLRPTRNIQVVNEWMYYCRAGDVTYTMIPSAQVCTSVLLGFYFVIVFSSHFSIVRSVTLLNKQEILIFDDALLHLLSIISIYDYIKRVDKKKQKWLKPLNKI